KSLHGIFGRVTVCTVYLDCIVRGVESRVGGVLLGHRHLARVPGADVLHPRDIEREQTADLVVAGHARDHLLHELVAADLLAEGFSLPRVLDRSIEACPHGAGGTRCDRVPAVVQTAHGNLETIALVADAVCLRHLDVAHEDRADVTGADAQAVLDRLCAQGFSARFAVEHEGRHPATAGFR